MELTQIKPEKGALLQSNQERRVKKKRGIESVVNFMMEEERGKVKQCHIWKRVAFAFVVLLWRYKTSVAMNDLSEHKAKVIFLFILQFAKDNTNKVEL